MQHVIELSEVCFRREGKRILSDLSWTIRPGEHWAFIGANGSGKTVTLRILLGHLWPTDGKVSVLGHAFGTYDLRKLRRLIGWVNFDIQHQFLRRHDTALEVVASGFFSTIGLFDQPVDDSLWARARARLQQMEVGDLAKQSFRTLSFGEQKRVLIARALITDPRLLILDEPCTGLDLHAREQFLGFVDALAREGEHSVIFVTHHTEEILPFITHCFLLKEGRAVAQGLKEETLTSEALSETFGIPVQVEQRAGRFWAQPA